MKTRSSVRVVCQRRLSSGGRREMSGAASFPPTSERTRSMLITANYAKFWLIIREPGDGSQELDWGAWKPPVNVCGDDTGCGRFPQTWADCHELHSSTNTNLTHLYIYTHTYKSGIGTYCTSTSTVLDPGVCTDTQYWYWLRCIPGLFPLCASRSLESLSVKCPKRLSGDGEGNSSGHLLHNTPQQHLKAWGSRRRLWSWKSPQEDECVDICRRRCSVSPHCICCCEHFSRPSRPSALLKDCFWSRIIKKHQGMPSVSQVVHFPVNAAVGPEYNSILRRLQPLTY